MPAVGGNAGAHHPLLRTTHCRENGHKTNGEMGREPLPCPPRDAWLKMQVFTVKTMSRVSRNGERGMPHCHFTLNLPFGWAETEAAASFLLGCCTAQAARTSRQG